MSKQAGSDSKMRRKKLCRAFGFLLSAASPFSMLSLLWLSPHASASTIPGTGAELAVIRQTTPSGDPSDPYSYPFLADIARSLARNGFPPSFFLGLDNKAPGIDLRTILLFEAGILKNPVKLFVPPKQKKSPYPSLSMTAIPESSGLMPSESAALLQAQPGLTTTAKSEIKSDAANKDENSGTTLNMDFNKFSIDLSKSALKNELTERTQPDSNTLAMAPALAVQDDSRPRANDLSFHFWTVPQAAAAPSLQSPKSDFVEGSYVMMSPSGLKAIEGRIFFLTGGHMLASSKQKLIIADTPVARVSVDAGASAFVEIVKPGLLRVRVLETKRGEHSVSVKFKYAEKQEEIRLSAGDDLIVSDKPLTDTDRALQVSSKSSKSSDKSNSKSSHKINNSAENWNKSSFSAKALFSSEAFFRTDLDEQNPAQKQALIDLKKRVK